MNQQTVEGPTQTAREGAAAEWAPRPFVAGALRVTIFVFPYVVGMVAALAISQWWSADRAGIHPLLWWAAVAIASTIVMIPADRFIRRLIPISSLLTIALTFPDAAPSRFRAAMRSSTTAQIKRRVLRAVENSATGEAVDRSQYMLDLVSLLTVHDRMTRGHSERVRAYSSLLGEELRLSKDDQQKLYWAALLHDIGKLDVPVSILNKSGRPNKAEWIKLQSHPAAAVKYLEPLHGWLGPWIRAADEHHLRWDGKGYPKSISGTDISKAGRIVAVADAYDVMTSARSYKAGMNAADARVELSACAGGQFDPTVVRAFLNIGFRRVQLVGGPLAALPALVGSLLNGAATTGGRVLLATSAVTAGVAASPPVEPPLIPAMLAYVEDASGWLSEDRTARTVILPETPTPAAARPSWQTGSNEAEPTSSNFDDQTPPAFVDPGTDAPTNAEAPPPPIATVVPSIPVATVAPQPEPQPQATVAPIATAVPQPILEPDPISPSSTEDGNTASNAGGNGKSNAGGNGNGNGNAGGNGKSNAGGNGTPGGDGEDAAAEEAADAAEEAAEEAADAAEEAAEEAADAAEEAAEEAADD